MDCIGNTPMVRLNRITSDLSFNVWAKLEFMNPSGSIKDRMARYIIEDAEKTGKLKPGGTVIENSSGNTGAGLSMISAARGYVCIITIPDKMSEEKRNFVKALGSKVVVTPTEVPADSPESYYSTARRLAQETEGSFYPDQYNNPLNAESHYATTGPEIWEQMKGKIDALVAGIGTGGTISGIGKFLRENSPGIKIIGVDPEGSVFYDYFKTGRLGKFHLYQVEGIGEDYLVKAIDFSVMDDIIQVDDRESFRMARRIAAEEGIFAGGSSGSALAAIMKGKDLFSPGDDVVVIFPDSGDRYLSKIYNDDWMTSRGFL